MKISESKKNSIDQAGLKLLLSYNPSTGRFRWKTRTSNRIRVGDVAGANNKGYIQIPVNGFMHRAHRLAWLYVYGDWPEDEIDHINGIRDDNRIHNLRSVSAADNNKNQKIHSHNTSGSTGVGWFKKGDSWRAYITVENKYIHLGCYSSFYEALTARKSAEIKYGFHPNHGAR